MSKGYAADAVKKQIADLRIQRDQLINQQREWKDSFAQTLGYVDEAIAEIEAAIFTLDGRDDAAATVILEQQEDEYNRHRAELLERNADTRDLVAEIAAIDGRIAALEASLRKLPEEGIVDESKVG